MGIFIDDLSNFLTVLHILQVVQSLVITLLRQIVDNNHL